MVVRQRLSSVCVTLFSLCEVSLGIRLEAEPECPKIVKTKRCYAMKLHELVRKNCNGSTFAVVDDVVCNILEALHNVLLITEDNFQSLPKCLEASEHRFKILVEVGFEVANVKFRDALMLELVNRG